MFVVQSVGGKEEKHCWMSMNSSVRRHNYCFEKAVAHDLINWIGIPFDHSNCDEVCEMNTTDDPLLPSILLSIRYCRPHYHPLVATTEKWAKWLAKWRRGRSIWQQRRWGTKCVIISISNSVELLSVMFRTDLELICTILFLLVYKSHVSFNFHFSLFDISSVFALEERTVRSYVDNLIFISSLKQQITINPDTFFQFTFAFRFPQF